MLSLCIIAKNEEKNLGNALESMKGIADEIIVVDTGSIDSTIKIAESYGARIIKHPWHNNFAESRNVSLSHASKKWIMWMDADDIVPEKSAKQINVLKKVIPDTAFIFHILNKNPLPDNPSCVKTSFPHLRMFPNHKGICFKGAIHESNYDSVKEKKIRILKTDIIIHHCGYSNIETVREKSIRNYRIQLQELGFPAKTQFYEYDFGQYHIYYAPNILSVFDVSKMKSFFLGEPFDYEPHKIITDGRLNGTGITMIREKVEDLVFANQNFIKKMDNIIKNLPSRLRINHELCNA